MFLPGKSHRQRNVACCSPWDHKKLDWETKPLWPLMTGQDLHVEAKELQGGHLQAAANGRLALCVHGRARALRISESTPAGSLPSKPHSTPSPVRSGICAQDAVMSVWVSRGLTTGKQKFCSVHKPSWGQVCIIPNPLTLNSLDKFTLQTEVFTLIYYLRVHWLFCTNFQMSNHLSQIETLCN